MFSPADFVSADQIIQGHRQLIEHAHARGVKIYGGTLTPFGGFPLASPQKEAMRQQINEWIRTSGAYDGVIDFDKATRDPVSPGRLLYDSGDHLHPNDAGYRAMAEAINLTLFRNDSR